MVPWKRSFAVALALVGSTATALGLVACTAAVEEQDGKTLNVATITTYPPYAYKDLATNVLTGFDIDIMNALAEKMGMSVNWIESSFDQLISFNAIKTGHVDAIIAAMLDTPKRQEVVNFLDYVHTGAVFYTLRSNEAEFPDIYAVCGKRVSVTRSSILATQVRAWSDENCVKSGKQAVIIVPTESDVHSRLGLNQGRADASQSNPAVTAWRNRNEGNPYLIFDEWITFSTFGIVFAKDDLQLGERLKAAMAEMLEDGTYRALLQKWDIPESAAIQAPMINGAKE